MKNIFYTLLIILLSYTPCLSAKEKDKLESIVILLKKPMEVNGKKLAKVIEEQLKLVEGERQEKGKYFFRYKDQ